MQTVHKASELSADERRVIERLLGRSLGEDEAFGLSAPVDSPIKTAPVGVAKQEASRRLMQHVERMSVHTRNVPEEELHAAIDEALAEVRQARP